MLGFSLRSGWAGCNGTASTQPTLLPPPSLPHLQRAKMGEVPARAVGVSEQ